MFRIARFFMPIFVLQFERLVANCFRGSGMEQECSAQHAREKVSVPMTAAADFVVPEGTDELSRSTRRA